MEEAAESNVVESVSDEQVNEYFESEGEHLEPVEDTPEQEQQAPAEESQEEKKDRFVPHEALHAERMKRKELQSRLEQQAQKVSQMEQNWQRLAESYQRQQQPQPPSFDEDPLEALRHDTEQVKQYINQQHQTEQQRQQAYEMQNRQQQFINSYQESAQEFAKTTPEFKDAYSFLSESRIKEYVEAGYSHAQANQLLIEDEMAIAAKAFQDGVNPAERMYKLAKVRGYQGKPQAQNLNAINKGMKMSKSLNGAGGNSANGISLDTIAHMSQKELDAFVANPKSWDTLSEIMK